MEKQIILKPYQDRPNKPPPIFSGVLTIWKRVINNRSFVCGKEKNRKRYLRNEDFRARIAFFSHYKTVVRR